MTPELSARTPKRTNRPRSNGDGSQPNTMKGTDTPMKRIAPKHTRKAMLLDALGVALLMLFCAALGVIAFTLAAPEAKADPEAVSYAAHYAQAVCLTLDEFPSTSGLLGIMQSVVEDGLTPRQAGEAVALSVYEVCPRHAYLLDLFVAKTEPPSVVA